MASRAFSVNVCSVSASRLKLSPERSTEQRPCIHNTSQKPLSSCVLKHSKWGFIMTALCWLFARHRVHLRCVSGVRFRVEIRSFALVCQTSALCFVFGLPLICVCAHARVFVYLRRYRSSCSVLMLLHGSAVSVLVAPSPKRLKFMHLLSC